MRRGVTIYNSNRAWSGYTLFCEIFPHLKRENEPKRAIYLIDMQGNLVHEWYVETTLQSYSHLLPNGNLIYPTHDRSEIAPGTAGLYEIDSDSNVIWHYRCRADHDFQVLPNNNLMINTITESMCPALGPELKRHPYIIEITRDKKLVWEWRGEKHLEELRLLLSPESWEHLMERAHGEFAFDWAHNNTLQIIPPNVTYEKEKASGYPIRFKPGNIFISYRSLDVIGVISRETSKIVWAWGPSVLDGQHKPHMLENGNILIFDNGTLRGYSRVIEFNPLNELVEWEYRADPKEAFFSRAIFGAQRLPNGNTLICDGMNSRLFEITPEKEIVWEFINPYHKSNARPSIYRCTRYSPKYVEPLLKKGKR